MQKKSKFISIKIVLHLHSEEWLEVSKKVLSFYKTYKFRIISLYKFNEMGGFFKYL